MLTKPLFLEKNLLGRQKLLLSRMISSDVTWELKAKTSRASFRNPVLQAELKILRLQTSRETKKVPGLSPAPRNSSKLSTEIFFSVKITKFSIFVNFKRFWVNLIKKRNFWFPVIPSLQHLAKTYFPRWCSCCGGRAWANASGRPGFGSKPTLLIISPQNCSEIWRC